MIVNRKATMIANRFRLGWGNRLLVFLRALLSRWMNLGSTEISRLGSLFIYGAERFIRGNDMQATFTFKEDLDLEQIRQSYERMIVENPVLRSKWTGNDKNRRYCWSEFTRNEWEERLAIEKDRAMKIHVPEKVGAEFFSTNERLPVRLTPIGKRKLVLSVNHVFSNGLGCLAWWDKWLTYYARATGHPIGECRAADDELSMVKELSYTKRFLMKGFSVFLAVVYMATLAAKAGRHAGRSTVDLTHGRKSVPNRSGYSTKAYALSRAETEEIVSRSKGKKISVSEYVCIALVESFFDKVPQKRRVLVSAPVDLREMLPEVHALDVGNYTGSLIFQIFRERSIEAQVHSSFKWMRRGVPYGVVKLLSLGMRDEYRVKERFERQAANPIPKRAPFENYTFAFSSVGKIKMASLERMVEGFHLITFSQTIMVILATGSFDRRLRLSVCCSKDLFDPEEVFDVTDRAVQRLKS